MANPRRSNWADVSDDESWDEEIKEEPIIEPKKPKNELQHKLESLSPPFTFSVGNLKFSIEDAEVIRSFLNLPPECDVQIIYHEERTSGYATLTVPTIELANSVTEYNGKVLESRPIKISLDKIPEFRPSRFPNRSRGRFARNFYNERGKRPARTDPRPKPKTNPFANATPVDTSKNNIEFEMKLQAQKSEEVTEEHYHVRKQQYKKVDSHNGQPETLNDKTEDRKEEVKAPKAWSNYEASLAILTGSPQSFTKLDSKTTRPPEPARSFRNKNRGRFNRKRGRN